MYLASRSENFKMFKLRKYQYIIKNYFLILHHFDLHVLLTEFIITNEFSSTNESLKKVEIE